MPGMQGRHESQEGDPERVAETFERHPAGGLQRLSVENVPGMGR
jgi:hypothetical protein